MNPPALTGKQREDARTLALEARRQRAETRASLRSGRISVVQILDSDAAAHRSMRVRDLLRAVPGIGPVRCSEILAAAGIAANKRVGGLSRLQRDRLNRCLDDRSTGGR